MADLPPTLPKDMYQPESANRDAARAVLIVTDNDTEDLEFFYPYYRFIEAGFKVDVATPRGESVKGKHGLELKETMRLAGIKADNYELLYLPGGKAPASLRSDKDALALTKAFFSQGKPIAAVCHGPQILAAADVIKGRKISAYPECQGEVEAAGATFLSRETLVDGPFITARCPGDLPAHMKQVLLTLGATKQAPVKQAA